MSLSNNDYHRMENVYRLLIKWAASYLADELAWNDLEYLISGHTQVLSINQVAGRFHCRACIDNDDTKFTLTVDLYKLTIIFQWDNE